MYAARGGPPSTLQDFTFQGDLSYLIAPFLLGTLDDSLGPEAGILPSWDYLYILIDFIPRNRFKKLVDSEGVEHDMAHNMVLYVTLFLVVLPSALRCVP